MTIDLHIHSTASDGTLTPAEILALAQKLGIKAIAITDHDTVDGSKKALSLKIFPNKNFLTGVEISTSFPEPFSCHGSLHLLGYDIDVDNPALNKALLKLKQARKNRNPGIIKRLKSLGMDISLNELSDKFQYTQVGRPHIAHLMKEKGFVKSIDEAFDYFLGTGKPAYVERFRLSPRDGIDCIRAAGGVPVLAHPFTLDLKFGKLRKCVGELVGYGLQGIEVIYSLHNDALRSRYMSLAKEFNLVATGGSDFHGEMNPSIKIGRGFGNVKVDDSVLVDLRKRIVQTI